MTDGQSVSHSVVCVMALVGKGVRFIRFDDLCVSDVRSLHTLEGPTEGVSMAVTSSVVPSTAWSIWCVRV